LGVCVFSYLQQIFFVLTAVLGSAKGAVADFQIFYLIGWRNFLCQTTVESDAYYLVVNMPSAWNLSGQSILIVNSRQSLLTILSFQCGLLKQCLRRMSQQYRSILHCLRRQLCMASTCTRYYNTKDTVVCEIKCG